MSSFCISKLHTVNSTPSNANIIECLINIHVYPTYHATYRQRYLLFKHDFLNLTYVLNVESL